MDVTRGGLDWEGCHICSQGGAPCLAWWHQKREGLRVGGGEGRAPLCGAHCGSGLFITMMPCWACSPRLGLVTVQPGPGPWWALRGL